MHFFTVRRARHLFVIVIAAALAGSLSSDRLARPALAQPAPGAGLEFIDTSVENASPLWYDTVDDVVRVHLLYDHERASPNRAAGHIRFVLHAQPGASADARVRESRQRLERAAGVGRRRAENRGDLGG